MFSKMVLEILGAGTVLFYCGKILFSIKEQKKKKKGGAVAGIKLQPYIHSLSRYKILTCACGYTFQRSFVIRQTLCIKEKLLF
jgi:hypothetical protein